MEGADTGEPPQIGWVVGIECPIRVEGAIDPRPAPEGSRRADVPVMKHLRIGEAGPDGPIAWANPKSLGIPEWMDRELRSKPNAAHLASIPFSTDRLAIGVAEDVAVPDRDPFDRWIGVDCGYRRDDRRPPAFVEHLIRLHVEAP